jgi:hypothetical protein
MLDAAYIYMSTIWRWISAACEANSFRAPKSSTAQLFSDKLSSKQIPLL